MAQSAETSPARIIVTVDADLADLIPGLLQRRQDDLQNLHAALQSRDWAALSRQAHTLKGSAGGFGFDRLSELGLRLEQGAKTGAADEIAAALQQMADYLARVEVTFV